MTTITSTGTLRPECQQKQLMEARAMEETKGVWRTTVDDAATLTPEAKVRWLQEGAETVRKILATQGPIQFATAAEAATEGHAFVARLRDTVTLFQSLQNSLRPEELKRSRQVFGEKTYAYLIQVRDQLPAQA